MGRVVAGLAVLVAGTAVWLLLAVWSFGRGDHVCKGVVVSGIAIGGMSRAEATEALARWADARLRQGMVLTALDGRWRGTPADLGARADISGALKRALAFGRTGGLLERLLCVFGSGGDGKRLTVAFSADEKKVRKAIEQVARQVDRPHRNATLQVANGRLAVRPDSSGVKLDREQALVAVTRAIASGGAAVPLPVGIDKADVTAADAARIDTLLSRYTTSFNPGKRDRTHNLVLAARSISGIILKPGGRFSANAAIGPREQERGFRNAIIFVKGRMEQGLGGGTCQVSSTLYNAVLLAGLKVVQRSHHSRTVPYVRPGLDATVAYGVVDFQFENSNSSPIGLISTASGSRLTVDIYGSAHDKRNVRVFTTQGKSIPAGSKVVVDKSLAPGVRKVVEPASPGVSATVYREITLPDGKVKRELVSRDRYAPQAAIIAVGPEVRTASTEAPSPPVP